MTASFASDMSSPQWRPRAVSNLLSDSTPGRRTPISARCLSVARAAAPQQAEQLEQAVRGLLVVGEPLQLALHVEARDEQGLLARVLADATGAVPGTEAQGLPAAHRQLHRQVVRHRLVDADGTGLDAAGNLLAARGVLGVHRAAEPVGRVVGQPD